MRLERFRVWAWRSPVCVCTVPEDLSELGNQAKLAKIPGTQPMKPALSPVRRGSQQLIAKPALMERLIPIDLAGPL
ncbi:hypothetical protein PSEEN3179 [Pseudomonas entomophila L48]|uniref:Uncharacterized protein n=1 Tax=Pseudomonas entomophila (strain L48) TaxID=384676 RepID=Q1I8T6_PSEE4|nr:hypothetical protein PSEEN3179 [Pseudomonas entomophila L48]